MADVAIETTNVQFLSKNTPVELAGGAAVANGSTAVLTPVDAVGAPTNTPGRSFHGRYMLVRITESGATNAPVVTAKAGATGGTPANLAAQGDLILAGGWTAAGNEDVVVQLELARFLQADGTVRLDVTGGTGAQVNVSVVHLSKNVL